MSKLTEKLKTIKSLKELTPQEFDELKASGEKLPKELTEKIASGARTSEDKCPLCGAPMWEENYYEGFLYRQCRDCGYWDHFRDWH